MNAFLNKITTSFFCLLFSLWGMAPGSVVCEGSDRDILDVFLQENSIEDSQEHLDLAKGQSCILFLGSTGAGKSTLVNGICQGPSAMVEVDEDGNELPYGAKLSSDEKKLKPKQLLERNGKTLFPVGAGQASVTKYPQVVEFRGNLLCDCPGFYDKAGLEKELVNTIATSTLLKNAMRVKVCFLLGEKEFLTSGGGRLGSLEMLLDTLQAMLKQGPHFKENLAKIHIIITCPIGQCRKDRILSILRSNLSESLSLSEENLDAIMGRVMFVDAADRASVFRDASYSYIWGWSSESQDRVATLVDMLWREDGWISPQDLNCPMTKKALDALEALLEALEHKAELIIFQGKDQNRLQKLEEVLRGVNKYQLPGLNVSKYIKAIERAKKNKDEQDEEVKRREEENIKADLREAAKESKKEMMKALATGIWMVVTETSGV